jgi:hypothetical protein
MSKGGSTARQRYVTAIALGWRVAFSVMQNITHLAASAAGEHQASRLQVGAQRQATLLDNSHRGVHTWHALLLSPHPRLSAAHPLLLMLPVAGAVTSPLPQLTLLPLQVRGMGCRETRVRVELQIRAGL